MLGYKILKADSSRSGLLLKLLMCASVSNYGTLTTQAPPDPPPSPRCLVTLHLRLVQLLSISSFHWARGFCSVITSIQQQWLLASRQIVSSSCQLWKLLSLGIIRLDHTNLHYGALKFQIKPILFISHLRVAVKIWQGEIPRCKIMPLVALPSTH